MNIVNLSGGKDSTYMLIEMLRRGIPVDLILFADVGIMAEFEGIYPYLERVEEYTGLKVTTVRHEFHTAINMFYGFPTKGNHMDEIRGFPPTIGTGCRYRSWLKVDPLEAASGENNDVYIGIAADEAHRADSLEYAKGKNRYHFPLVEWGITEKDCLEGLKEIGLYNPLYDFFDRLGCFFCPKQPINSLRNLWKHFPQLWVILRQMEVDQGRPFQANNTAVELELRFEKEAAGEYKKFKRRGEKIKRDVEDIERLLETIKKLQEAIDQTDTVSMVDVEGNQIDLDTRSLQEVLIVARNHLKYI